MPAGLVMRDTGHDNTLLHPSICHGIVRADCQDVIIGDYEHRNPGRQFIEPTVNRRLFQGNCRSAVCLVVPVAPLERAVDEQPK